VRNRAVAVPVHRRPALTSLLAAGPQRSDDRALSVIDEVVNRMQRPLRFLHYFRRGGPLHCTHRMHRA
jgi:hypothetical protein